MMSEITNCHVMALDIAGWRIVHRDGEQPKWPFDSKYTGCECPAWCDDVSAKPQKDVTDGEAA
jgi:hypothetical protein